MSEVTNLIFIFLMWMFLDLIGLITFKKTVKERKKWKFWSQLKAIIAKKYLSISLVIEIACIFCIIYSFFIPWYYHAYRSIMWGTRIEMFHLIEADYLQEVFSIMLYYSYIIGLAILFSKISVKKKSRCLPLLEISEVIFIFPGIMLLFSVRFGRLHNIFHLYPYYSESYPSFGYILFIIGFTVILINGLQYSIYSRFFKRK